MPRRAQPQRLPRNGFLDIAASIRQAIESGTYPVGSYLPTEAVLQREYGASRSTIRKALASVTASGYGQQVPNRGVIAMPGVRHRRTKNVALIDGGSYVMRVLTIRLGDLLVAKGYNPVHMGGSPDYPFEYTLQRAIDGEFSGAIVWSYEGFPELDFIARSGDKMPVVALDHRLAGAETDLVTFDQESAALEATEQLIRQGCRRIGVSGMLDMLEVTHLRFRGYMRAMFRHGLQPEPRDFVFVATSGRDKGDSFPLESRLRAADPPDGLLVLQDMFVPLTIEAALRAGMNLPRDLKISTIGDDIDVDVDGHGLTAVAFDWEAMANEALRLFAERLDNSHAPYQLALAPHRMNVRGLCGAPRSDWNSPGVRYGGFKGEPPVPRSRFRYSSRWTVQDDGRDSHS